MVGVLFLMTILGCPESIAVPDPTAVFAMKAAAGSDTAGCVLVKVAADFTGDGMPDLALSATCGWDDAPGWGNAKGPWEIWARRVNADTTYCFTARVFFHPFAVKVTPSDGGAILTTYHRIGPGEGYLVRDRLAGTVLQRLEERHVTTSSDSFGAWFEEMFPISGRLACHACRLADFLERTPTWVPGYSVPSEPD